MKKIIVLVISVMLVTGLSFADRVYVEDRGTVIPIDTETGDIKTISNGNGTETWIYDHGSSTDIVHPDGTTTTVYDN